jgi:hypothetical protein
MHQQHKTTSWLPAHRNVIKLHRDLRLRVEQHQPQPVGAWAHHQAAL